MARARQILLIDDDEILRDSLAEQLELTGEFATACASTGAEGIATKICKGNASCAALPGSSIILRLTEAAPYSCSLREEPAGCVERVQTRRPFLAFHSSLV